MSNKNHRKPGALDKKRDGFLSKNIYLILAFFIPFLIMFVCFALFRVSPFGSKQILVTDLWHQYYPFLVDFQSKLKTGGSLLWTWKSGCGTNYISLLSYYLASPLNFLSVLVPSNFLREFLYIAVCVKIGCAGLFFAAFLKITYKINDISITLFSVLYALCSFIMGYYWNIIWLDTIALLPLVIAGTIALLRHGRFRLYIVTLALSVLANYYMGLFTCIFVLLISIGYSIVQYKGLKELSVNLLKMAGCSAVGIAMSAVLTLPAFFALGHTYSSGSTFPTEYAINIGSAPNFRGTLEAIRKVIANSIAFIEPTSKEGLPNIYCGVIAIILGILYLTCKKIKLRERIFSVALLAFFVMSFIIRQLDYIWHGFHFTNMIPYRFSFLFSFVLILMAFSIFTLIDGIKPVQVLITAAVFFAILIISAGFDSADAVVASSIIGFLILILLILYSFKIIPKRALSAALCIIVLAEASHSAYTGIKTVNVTDALSYPPAASDAESVIEMMETNESSGTDLYRAEMAKQTTLNDNALYGYNGISMFNSLANADVTRYMETLGICGWPLANRYTYQENSPVTNLFLNLKYLISASGEYLNKDYFSIAGNSGNVKLLKNNMYLPQGFMVNERLLEFDPDNITTVPLVNQNSIFNLATGLDGEIYEYLNVETQEHTDFETFPVIKQSFGNYTFSLNNAAEQPRMKFNYRAPHDGLAYAYFSCNNADYAHLMVNDKVVTANYTKQPYIMEIGNVKEGDKISVYANLENVISGSCMVYCAMFNKELFETGYNKLAQNTMKATKITDSKIEGKISVDRDGLFYTSVAADPGWKAFVDGERVEITPVGNAMVAFRLSRGEHNIKLTYLPQGLAAGAAISIFALALFVLLLLIFCTKERRFYLWSKDICIKQRELIMYLIFGVLTTGVSWVSYALFTKLIPDFWLFGLENTSVIASNILSWILSVTFAYVTNKIWVFSSRSFMPSVVVKEALLFFSSRLATGAVEWVGVPMLLWIGLNRRILGIEGMAAKICISVIVVILNYVLSKLFVFKKQSPPDKTEMSDT